MKEKDHHNIYNTIFHWYNFRLKLVMEGLIIGIITGFLVVAYRFLLEKSSTFTPLFYLWQRKNPSFIPLWFLLLIVIGYLVGLIVKKEPMISGSGIPQVKGVLLGHLEMNWWKVILGKFIGGVLSIGSGLSLGREGPSVQLGAAVGQGFSRLLRRVKIEEKYLLTAGASAGLAAAFNAPLAGAIFALEEIHKNFSPLVLLSALSASLAADFVSKEFFGLKPVFSFHQLAALPLDYYFYLVILGIILGLLGTLFNIFLFESQALYAKQKWLPIQARPIIALLAAGVLGFFLPEVLGGGNNLIVSLTQGKFVLGMLLVFLVVKFLFTMLSYGSGAPGGIFLPLLVIGALAGDIYGNFLFVFLHFPAEYINNFIVLAMAGYFTAIVKAPITGAILITEMTGSFSHLLSLSMVSIVAYLITDILGSQPVYDGLLTKILAGRGFNKFSSASRAKTILEIAVCVGTFLDGKMIKEVSWPAHCLLVGIKRGEVEIIPNGKSIIQGGDYLIVLVDEKLSIPIRESLLKLAGTCLIKG